MTSGGGDVVDENVLRTANGEADHVDDACMLAAIDYLLDCQDRRALVLDDLYRLIDLYASHCSYSGQPGVGDQFFVWAHTNIGSLRRVRLQESPSGDWASFPDDPGLASFDRDDRV